MVFKWEVAVAEGYRVANDIILGGAIIVFHQVHPLTPARKGAYVRLNYEWRTVVELREVGKLKGG